MIPGNRIKTLPWLELLMTMAMSAASPLAQAYGAPGSAPMDSPLAPDVTAEPPGEPPRWNRALPFLGQRALDRGYNLPNPYNIGMSLYLGDELRNLSDLNVSLNDNPLQDASFVEFRKTRIKPVAFQYQLGAWLFPFLNVYALAGYTSGHGNIDIAIPGAELMQFLGIGGCGLPAAARPDLCSKTIEGTAHANYTGYTWGGGFTAAGAYKKLFFSLPVTYVVADVTQSTTDSETWNIAPRIGWLFQPPRGGMVTAYVGGTYMKSDVFITGSAVMDTADTIIGHDTALNYSIMVQPKEAWNYFVGAHWMATRTWSFLGEVGFGGSRKNVLMNVFYRF